MCEIGAFKRMLPKGAEVTAWRVWRTRVTGNGHVELRAVVKPFIWNALLTNVAPIKPTKLNESGFWCRKARSRRLFRQGGDVYGQVRLSGVIAEHTGGYRASHAEILSLSRWRTKFGLKKAPPLRGTGGAS